MTEKEKLLEEITKQEEELVFDSFSNEDAYRLGNIIYELAKKESLPVVIDVSRCGQVLYHVGLTGSTPDNDAWVRRKINTVMRFGHSSYFISTAMAAWDRNLHVQYCLDPKDYACCGGSFPIRLKASGTVGTVTVSGLEDWNDHGLVVRGLREYFKG